jgi:hypothetical protein
LISPKSGSLRRLKEKSLGTDFWLDPDSKGKWEPEVQLLSGFATLDSLHVPVCKMGFKA